MAYSSPRFENDIFLSYARVDNEEFYQEAQESPESLRIGTRCRIVNALLYNIHHDDWPPEYKGLGASKLFDASETDLGDPSRGRIVKGQNSGA